MGAGRYPVGIGDWLAYGVWNARYLKGGCDEVVQGYEQTRTASGGLRNCRADCLRHDSAPPRLDPISPVRFRRAFQQMLRCGWRFDVEDGYAYTAVRRSAT